MLEQPRNDLGRIGNHAAKVQKNIGNKNTQTKFIHILIVLLTGTADCKPHDRGTDGSMADGSFILDTYIDRMKENC